MKDEEIDAALGTLKEYIEKVVFQQRCLIGECNQKTMNDPWTPPLKHGVHGAWRSVPHQMQALELFFELLDEGSEALPNPEDFMFFLQSSPHDNVDRLPITGQGLLKQKISLFQELLNTTFLETLNSLHSYASIPSTHGTVPPSALQVVLHTVQTLFKTSAATPDGSRLQVEVAEMLVAMHGRVTTRYLAVAAADQLRESLRGWDTVFEEAEGAKSTILSLLQPERLPIQEEEKGNSTEPNPGKKEAESFGSY